MLCERRRWNWVGAKPLIRTLDRDLGKTGTEMARREDFKTLVADVSMGQVGAVFALEVSRLARSNLDWHRLLELCALTETLVIDEDGCYDPADFNDGLLLGLKGAMAQAELHFLHARLQGGKLNKAKKGELRFPLPVGFCYDEQGRIILDPDEEVRGAVGLVFRLFRETGTAFAVMQRFAESALRFPKRSYGGAWDGKIVWGRLTHSRVLGMLKNPSYAGMYVFGRYRYRREINSEGEVQKRIHEVAMADWRVILKEHHEGYVTVEEFFKNQERLEKNRTQRRGDDTDRPSARRVGLTARAAVVRQLVAAPLQYAILATAAFTPAINERVVCVGVVINVSHGFCCTTVAHHHHCGAAKVQHIHPPNPYRLAAHQG